VHGKSKFAADFFPQQRAQLRVGFAGVETVQVDAGYQPFTIPIQQHSRERMRAGKFCFPIAAENQHALIAQLPQEMAQ
jgi:hypothetical protein